MGIGKLFRKVGSTVAHPVQAVKRSGRKKLIAVAIAAILSAAGWQTSPAFREAVTTAVDSIWTAVEEAPPELSPVETGAAPTPEAR